MPALALPIRSFGLPRLAATAVAAGLFSAAAWQPAQAQDTAQPRAASGPAASPSIYIQGARGLYNTQSLTLGATLPWGDWQRPLWGGELRGHWDLYLSRWLYDARPGGHGSNFLVGITPTLRLTPDGGRASWFVEAGIGATLADRRYFTPEREFSTRFNFASHLGVGMRLGERRQHEWLLRVQHVSNAGIKDPNPGANFLQLRYALHF